jgi:hypothetical protein
MRISSRPETLTVWRSQASFPLFGTHPAATGRFELSCLASVEVHVAALFWIAAL